MKNVTDEQMQRIAAYKRDVRLRQVDGHTECSFIGLSPIDGAPMPVVIRYPWPLSEHAKRMSEKD